MLKSKFIAAGILCIMFFSSCDNEEFFELERPPAAPWQTTNELEQGVVAAYHHTFYHSWGNYHSQLRVLFYTMSDAAYLLEGAAANVPYNEMYYRTTEVPGGVDYTSNSYGKLYSTIGSINVVIDFLRENDREPFPNMTDKDRQNIDRIEGEMLALRAYSYYHLALVFAPVPGSPDFASEEVLALRLTFPKNSEEASAPEYVTSERLYEAMVEDLLAAKKLLPESYDASVHHAAYRFGRINRYTAAAILAKVYFQLGEFGLAEDEMDYVISGPFSLSEEPIESFNRDNLTKSNETIWSAYYGETIMDETPKPYTVITKNPYWALGGGRGENFWRSTWNLWPLSHAVTKQVGWMNDDLEVTLEALNDKRYVQLYYRFEGNPGNAFADPSIYEMVWPQIKKPYVWGDKYFRANVGAGSNVPVIRLAEMYLTRAIIRLNENNDAQGAADDLNQVRQRAWMGDGPYVPVTASEITAEMIHNERLKELTTEGDRLNYLRALRLPIPPGDREGVAPIEFPYESLVWEIPIQEQDFRGQR